MTAEGLQRNYDAAKALQKTHPAEAISQLRDVVLGEHQNDAETIKVKESAISTLADLYAAQGNAEALRQLLTELRPLFATVPKAKTAKIVRGIIETVARVPGSGKLQLEICREQVEWARAEKRTFLRQRIEARLANLLLEMGDYSGALALISKLLSEVKKLDDKLLLVDVHLLESRTHHSLRNHPKAKAALTAARTAANAIYIPPALQADIDSQSGTLHAEEKDYKTAYSYFYEAFEGLSALDDPHAVQRLKHMLLCKIMTGKGDAEEVPAIVATKAGLKYAGLEVESMKAVAAAYQARSLQAFQDSLATYRPQLVDDAFVNAHLTALYNTLLEENLARLIEPFSRVEIAHVAEIIKLPVKTVEETLSLMILDGKLAGTLDQGAGCLDVFEDAPADAVYPAALSTFEHVGRAIDNLIARSHRIAV